MSYDFSQFGCQVFNDTVMREKLSRSTYRSLRHSIDDGAPLGPEVAEVVASAMKTGRWNRARPISPTGSSP